MPDIRHCYEWLLARRPTRARRCDPARVDHVLGQGGRDLWRPRYVPTLIRKDASRFICLAETNTGTDSSKPVAGIAASKTLVICHTGDDICQFGDLITLEHLTYSEDTPQAASFIVSQI